MLADDSANEFIISVKSVLGKIRTNESIIQSSDIHQALSFSPAFFIIKNHYVIYSFIDRSFEFFRYNPDYVLLSNLIK